MTQSTSPWDRFGRWVAVPWLIFLVFPLVDTWVNPRSLTVRLAATTIILVFATIYTAGFGPQPEKHLFGLIVLTAIYLAIDGLTAVGLLPFIAAFANVMLPLRWGLSISGSTVAASFLMPAAVGQLDGYWPLAIIVTSVAIGTAIVAVIDTMAVTHQALDQQIVKTDERIRIARDVHDVLGHSLTIIALKADLASRLLETVDAEPSSTKRLTQARSELSDLQTATRSALADIRTTVGGLRITSLEAELAAATEVLTDAGVTVTCSGEPDDVSIEVRQLFAWAVREGTTNIVRHARASTCTFELTRSRLRISDDGIGLDLDLASTGNGLRGLRERVEQAGATLEVASASPGTTLEIVAGS